MIYQAFLLLTLLLSSGALGETTFTMLDGKEVTVPANLTSAQLEEWIKKISEAMFNNSGQVGERDSLSYQNGSRIVKDTLKRLLRDIAFQDRLFSARDRIVLDNDESKAIRRSAAKYVEDNFEGLGTNQTLESLKAQIAYYDSERAKKREQIQIEQAELEKSYKQDVASQQTSRGYIELLENDLERSARKEAPERERLRLMEKIGPTLAYCHDQLFNAIPAALSGYHPPKLSPALFAAVKKRIQNDPKYAAHFQKEMRIHPATSDRTTAQPGALQIGSAQGLDLFLTAGESLPKAERAYIGGKAKINPYPAAFDVNTAPLFAKLAADYGADLGPKEGLKFEGTPTVQTLEAVGKHPNLTLTVQKAVAPPAPRDRRGYSFSTADCGEVVSTLSKP